MYRFELLLQNEATTADDWRRFFTVLKNRLKSTKLCTITVNFDGSGVHYWLDSTHNLMELAEGLDGFLMRPTDGTTPREPLPFAPKQRHLIRISKTETLLELKEKYKVAYGATITMAVLDVRSLGGKTPCSLSVFIRTAADKNEVIRQRMLQFPAYLLAVDYSKNSRVSKSVHEYTPSTESVLKLLSSEPGQALLRVQGYPFFEREYYLPLRNFEFDKHTLVLGQSGSGKSKFLAHFIDQIQKNNLQDTYRVVVIDPHAALINDIKHIASHKVIDFQTTSTEVFARSDDVTTATELTCTLLLSLMSEHLNAYLERTLKQSVFLLYSAGAMSFMNLRMLVTELDYRKSILSQVEDKIPQSVSHFFYTDFNDMRSKHYVQAIEPITTLIDDMALLPALNLPNQISLEQTVHQNFLTMFSLNKMSLGEKVVKTVAGLVIQSVFQLAQSRTLDRKLILVIDEVSVVQNPTLAPILSEARKFGLSVVLTQQYLGQLAPDLKNAIHSNVYNYFVFKVSEDDARVLEGNLHIELPLDVVKSAEARGLNERDVRIRMFTQLHHRQCLARVYAHGMFCPCVKASTLDS